MSHYFGRKLPATLHSFGKKLSHSHNVFNKMHHTIKQFNEVAVPVLSTASIMNPTLSPYTTPSIAILKGGEALTSLMSSHHNTPHHASFDGQSNYAKQRRPTLER